MFMCICVLIVVLFPCIVCMLFSNGGNKAYYYCCCFNHAYTMRYKPFVNHLPVQGEKVVVYRLNSFKVDDNINVLKTN